MVKAQLAEHEMLVAGYGGDIDAIEISALSGKGVDKLLETVALTAELLELKADPEAPLEAVVVESTKDTRKGVTASVIVQQGTLAVRQNLVVPGEETPIEGRVRRLSDDLGNSLEAVTPGSPAEVIGLNEVPPVGSVVRDLDAAYDAGDAVELATEESSVDLSPNKLEEVDFDALFDEKPKLKLIIKADVEGTLEAIEQNLDDDSVELIQAGVGPVTERDVEYATTSDAAIIAFHTKVPRKIKEMAKQQDVLIRKYDVIYNLIEDLQKQMLKLMDATIDEVTTGEAEILQIFEIKGQRIAGCRVITGEIKTGDKLHLLRDGEIIADPTIRTLQHGQNEIDRVTAKSEFGMTFKQNKLDFQVGDKIVAYYVEDEA
jgi:translation initiation factor IF-2